MATLRIDHQFQDGAGFSNTTRWGRTSQDYLLTSFMLSADPARFVTPDLDDPSSWQVARSLPTFKDQRNTILANQTNRSLQLGGEDGLRHDLDLGIELTENLIHGSDSAESAAREIALWFPGPDVAVG